MRRLIILGGGESGFGSAVLAKKQGWSVFVSDIGTLSDGYRKKFQTWEIEFEEGRHTAERILSADEVVKSPGIPDTAPMVQRIKDAGIPIISEIEFAGRYTKAHTICITGSNGKSTVAELTYKILRDGGINVGLGGNIGDSFAFQVATQSHDWYVLELSSFQLDGMSEFRADIAILTNITPDHLDRYNNSFSLYTESKMQIIRNQRTCDYFIYCDDDKTIVAQLPKCSLPMHLLPFSTQLPEQRGAYLEGGSFYVTVGEREFSMTTDKLKIYGRHNVYNAMAATMAAMAVGVDSEAISKALSDFRGVEHRLEHVGIIGGVEYINDSKATNVDAVWFALEGVDAPVIWIAGGTDKGNDYSMLKSFASTKIKSLICMGVDNVKLIDYFKGIVPEIYSTHSMEEAMSTAHNIAQLGDTVLLSPACASFDLFKNYEDRGHQFKDWVLRRVKK